MSLLEVGWQRGSSSHKIYPLSDAAGLCPGNFIFTRSIVQNLGYLISLDSQPCPIQRISQGIWSVVEGHIGVLLPKICLGSFQCVLCIQKYNQPKAMSFLVSVLFWPRVCPELLEGPRLFLWVSAFLWGYPNFSEDLTVFLILSCPSDRIFTFPSRCLSLGCVALLRYFLGSVTPASPYHDNASLDGFIYLGIPFSTTDSLLFPSFLWLCRRVDINRSNENYGYTWY